MDSWEWLFQFMLLSLSWWGKVIFTLFMSTPCNLHFKGHAYSMKFCETGLDLTQTLAWHIRDIVNYGLRSFTLGKKSFLAPNFWPGTKMTAPVLLLLIHNGLLEVLLCEAKLNQSSNLPRLGPKKTAYRLLPPCFPDSFQLMLCLLDSPVGSSPPLTEPNCLMISGHRLNLYLTRPLLAPALFLPSRAYHSFWHSGHGPRSRCRASRAD